MATLLPHIIRAKEGVLISGSTGCFMTNRTGKACITQAEDLSIITLYYAGFKIANRSSVGGYCRKEH